MPLDQQAPGSTGLAPGLATALGSLRQQLVDISKRNRLTNAPVGKSRANQLDIEDEISDEVFKTLYLQGKKMTFEAFRGTRQADPASEDTTRVYVPPEQDPSGSGLAAHHVDLKLQTRLTAEGLQKRLLTLFRGAQSLEEEQGISVLFLALGFLRWFESESSEKERYAPLVLLPADLQRDSVRGRFRLSFRDQDLEPNMSLRAMLASDFDLSLPNFPEGSDWLPSDYFRAVREAVSSRPRWQVRANTIELSFYSFAKFLMWKDLSDGSEWGEGSGLARNDLLERLLVGGFESGPGMFAPDENLDKRFPDPKELGHILDADTSQTKVIAAARAGRNLVVQGPPGTGKSQTIANIIGVAARDGKRVLFVAEKRAALDVVHDRLESCGLGPLCLELHSHKAIRKHVYAELKRTLQLGAPKSTDDSQYQRVRELRDELNRLSSLLHRVDDATGETPYGIIGRISELGERDVPQPAFRISGADTWSREEFAERANAVSALAALTSEHGGEATHIWRGARKRLTQLDRLRLSDSLRSALTRLESLQATVGTAAKAAGIPDASCVSAATDIAPHLDALIAMPEAVPSLLNSSAVREQPGAVLDLCETVAELHEQKSDLLSHMIESALELPWDQVRLEIAARGRSWLRWLSGSYRNAVAQLRSVQRSELPKGLDDQLAILDGLLRHQRLKRAVGKAGFLGRDAFGYAWRNEETDIRQLLPAMQWIVSQAERLGHGEEVKRQVESVPLKSELSKLATDLRGMYQDWLGAWDRIAEATDLEVGTAFGTGSIQEVRIGALRERLAAWTSDTDSIEGWHRLSAAGRYLDELGLSAVRNRLADGRLRPACAREALSFVRADAVWERMRRSEPGLEEIDGADRSAKLERFKTLDGELQALAAQEIALQHFRSLPAGSAGQIGVVRGEVNKKTRHLRLRKLLDKAGEAVAMVKPVFLMSPLSVAQYLKPGGLRFDLLLIDEASQVRPADAMGAIMRSRQVIVVGDQKQMPPTSFFDRQVSDERDVEFEDIAEIQASQVGDMESILSLCESRAMPGTMLRWHYRSRHPSLIEVSNHEFYDNALVCPPSPDMAGKTSGLTFQHVDGAYDRGRKRNNPKEADAIVGAVLAHAREHPDETLGVVALSVAQRDTIRDALEFKRAEIPELEAFCKEGKDDEFFVKNLENVQGDERDVIFISIGYGRDSGGYMSQSFGPVSSEGGERRLNVLFTRAKSRCRVFSSIRHTDIRLDVTKHAGPRVLKRFLKFAETGELDIPVLTGGEPDSPFEEAVARAIQNHGFRVAGQVGSSGFKIDLAVYDPDHEGRFLLAVECDGARYHSSSWARERDRLRQVVLEQKGWRFHRIWSTDWFYNREAEMAKLLDAIERARANRDWEARPVSLGKPLAVERSEPVPDPEPKRTPYIESSFDIPQKAHGHIYEIPTVVLAGLLERVVELEGPIHVAEASRRLSRLWGYKRTGKRIREAVENAIRLAVNDGRIQYASPSSNRFIDSRDGTAMPTVRDRSNAGPSIRRLDRLPPTELQAAILSAVERNIGIGAAACAVEVARMLGYNSTSSGMRVLVASQAKVLVDGGRLHEVGSELRLA